MIKIDPVAWPYMSKAMAISDTEATACRDAALTLAGCISRKQGVLTEAGQCWRVLWYLAADDTLRPMACIPAGTLSADLATRTFWTFDQIFRNGAFPDHWLSPRRLMHAEYHEQSVRARKEARLAARRPVIQGDRMLVQLRRYGPWSLALAAVVEDGRAYKVELCGGHGEAVDFHEGFALDNRDEGFDALWSRGARQYETYLAARGALHALHTKKTKNARGAK